MYGDSILENVDFTEQKNEKWEPTLWIDAELHGHFHFSMGRFFMESLSPI